MTLRSYLVAMAVATAAAIAMLALILNAVDPGNTSGVVFAVFYACVFLAVSGLLSILGFSARVFILNRRTFISQEVALAFRQSTLIAAMVVGGLLLKSHDRLNWWTGTLMVIIVTLGESFFISGRRARE
ncbi:MAG: hypothetical protein RLZZ324_992 [Candidatus Parcubacteria bacterium]|jgi:hypothetical protein